MWAIIIQTKMGCRIKEHKRGFAIFCTCTGAKVSPYFKSHDDALAYGDYVAALYGDPRLTPTAQAQILKKRFYRTGAF